LQDVPPRQKDDYHVVQVTEEDEQLKEMLVKEKGRQSARMGDFKKRTASPIG
jgi:hypothetical protein